MSSASGELGDFTAAQLRVVRGEPDDIEVAALVAGIVAARAAVADDGAARARAVSPWSDPGRRFGRQVPTPGPATWRWSLHP